MIKKSVILMIILLAFSPIMLISQQNSDKYTSVNVMIYRVFFTRLGMIVEYSVANEVKALYLPNKFFIEGIAVRIVEDDMKISPQMSVIYKNGEPFRVKVYIPSDTYGDRYQLLEYLTQDIIDKFKNTDKLVVELYQPEANK